MSEFTSIINHKELFQVEVQFRPIVDVLNFINEELKSIDKRISSLELVSKTHVLLEDHESTIKKMDERITTIEESASSFTNGISSLSNDIKSLESKTNLTIDERVNDILVSTNMNINHSTNTFNAQVRQNGEMLKNIQQEVNDFIASIDKSNFEPLKENVKKNTNEIKELKKKIAKLSLKENSTHLSDLIQDVSLGNDKIDSKNNDFLDAISKQIDKQNDDIHNLSFEINEIKEKLSMLNESAFLQSDDIISVSSLSSSPSKNLYNDELLNLKNEFGDHQSKVVNAMKAIQYELQQIRDNGQGLLDLPPLNLHNVVPTFFNEDKKIISLSDSESAPVLQLAEKSTEEEEENKKEMESKRNFSKEVERRKYISVESILKNKSKGDNDNVSSNTNHVVIKNDGSPTRNCTTERIITQSNIDTNQIIRKIKDELNINDIQKSFQQFKKDHDEIINSIERKVDREYVERLFDKFRIIVHSMNDRVKELAALTDDYATKEEFKLILQFVKNLPKDGKPGTAVKRGPTCLFCGRPKTSIAGEISPRTAAMAGSPPVSNVSTKDGEINCEFVYGDGQAYYKRDDNFQSFPHFDILPPLPSSENDDGRNVNKSSTEVSGRINLTRNGERAKTSLSMPNSRVSKSRK